MEHSVNHPLPMSLVVAFHQHHGLIRIIPCGYLVVMDMTTPPLVMIEFDDHFQFSLSVGRLNDLWMMSRYVCGDGMVSPSNECEPPNTGCCDSLCFALPPSTRCRNSTGICDVPEYCDGVSSQCPIDT